MCARHSYVRVTDRLDFVRVYGGDDAVEDLVNQPQHCHDLDGSRLSPDIRKALDVRLVDRHSFELHRLVRLSSGQIFRDAFRQQVVNQVLAFHLLLCNFPGFLVYHLVKLCCVVLKSSSD